MWAVKLSSLITRWVPEDPYPHLHPSTSMWSKPHCLFPLHQCPQAYPEPALSSSKKRRSGREDSLLVSKAPSQSVAPSFLSSRVVIFFTGVM